MCFSLIDLKIERGQDLVYERKNLKNAAKGFVMRPTIKCGKHLAEHANHSGSGHLLGRRRR
jgi:hypothetical protein